MRHGDLSPMIGSMEFALKTLQQRWDEAQAEWNDANARHFEETFVAPLLPETRNALKAMDRLSQVLTKACNDCA